MAKRKTVAERILEKKDEEEKLSVRIEEDQKKREELQKEIRDLEAEEVFTILNEHNLSVKDLNELLKHSS